MAKQSRKKGPRPTTKESLWATGHLYRVDDLPHLDDSIGPALGMYPTALNKDRQSRFWLRAVVAVENILFGVGRQYIDDILVSRLSKDSAGTVSVARDVSSKIPRPTNDLLGRYIETNIALLTENRPRPRITSKSDNREDRIAAELSEYVIEYLWEKLKLPERSREIARMMLYSGTCWLEVCYDPLIPRHMKVAQTETEEDVAVPTEEGVPPIRIPGGREVPVVDKQGRPVYGIKTKYGDVNAKVVTPFEMYLPMVHEWNGDDMGWVMREQYIAVDELRDKYLHKDISGVVTKKNGWNVENIKNLQSSDSVQSLPLWWWERMTDLVEGPAPSLYTSTPETWDGYTVLRIFDRKPNPKWPKGRTIITAGDKVIYDSPKEVGGRAFDPRWPNRWHPYIRFRWTAQPGSVYGRALVTQLLPKLKRVNAIDTTLIMWRRTIPIASWIFPTGSHPVEGMISGMPGHHIRYDPRRTQQNEPKPVYPPEYPASALKEREIQIAEMESIAGTEEILRGQRPVGVNSATALNVLRKQALASRSAVLQSWDDSLQELGTALLQETIKHVQDDEDYAERIKILAREKASRITIKGFSGSDLSDNVIVRVDTASMAMVSQEAKQARAIEVMQYAQGLMSLPPTLRANLIDDLGWPDGLIPQGADINRAQMLLGFIKQNQTELVVPLPEDDPYLMHEFFTDELKSESFLDLTVDQQQLISTLIDHYRAEVKRIEEAKIEFQIQLAQQGAPPEMAG